MCYNPEGNNINIHCCEIPKFLSTIFCSLHWNKKERLLGIGNKVMTILPGKRKDGIYDDYY
jgi:hypothetical protein